MRFRIAFSIAALAIPLAGCGLAARAALQKEAAGARVATEQGFADCKARFPEGSGRYVEGNACNARAASLIRPYVPYPDLFDKDWAFRALLAERLQAGKMTLAEANQQGTQYHSQIAAEEQQRNLASRAVAAQELAADAASSPVICNRVGNSTICN